MSDADQDHKKNKELAEDDNTPTDTKPSNVRRPSYASPGMSGLGTMCQSSRTASLQDRDPSMAQKDQPEKDDRPLGTLTNDPEVNAEYGKENNLRPPHEFGINDVGEKLTEEEKKEKEEEAKASQDRDHDSKSPDKEDRRLQALAAARERYEARKAEREIENQPMKEKFNDRSFDR